MPLLEDCTGPISYNPLENMLGKEEVQPKERKTGQGNLRDRTCRLQEGKHWKYIMLNTRNFGDSFVDQKRSARNRKKNLTEMRPL